MNNYLSFDIGGTNVKYGILNEKGEILFKDKFPTNHSKDGFLSEIVEITENCKKKFDIKAVAMSMPGVIDTKHGHLVTAGALMELYDFPIKAELESRIKLPVSVENDVNCVALAEKWIGKGKDSKNFICLAIGTGIGGAIIINDRLYTGHRFAAGEFGFMLPKGIQGENSRLSTLSLTSSVEHGIIQAYKRATGDTEVNGEIIFDRYKAKDSVAVEVFDNFYTNLAVGLFNLSFALDPEKILIGGAISGNQEVIEEINNYVLKIKNSNEDLKNLTMPVIEACQFNNDSGIIGALYNYLSEVKN